jgi:hypothetical protein
MRAAPPVQVELTRSAGWQGLQAVLYGLAAAALAMWLLDSAGTAALAGALCAGAAWRLVPVPRGMLAWDGVVWRFEGQPCDVVPAIDAGRWLLLRLRLTPEGSVRSQWAGIGERDCGPAWHGFRCAVYCPRPTPHEADLLDSEPPPAPRTPP